MGCSAALQPPCLTGRSSGVQRCAWSRGPWRTRRARSGYFFFQAEDGIRDLTVAGVQTCALPISGGTERRDPRLRGKLRRKCRAAGKVGSVLRLEYQQGGADVCVRWSGDIDAIEIGRASCRERV